MLPEIYEFGEFKLYTKKKQLFRNNELVSIAPKAFKLLQFLIENRDTTFSNDEILDKVWKEDIVEPSNVTQTISIINKVLGSSDYIGNTPKFGYRFVGSIRELSEADLLKPYNGEENQNIDVPTEKTSDIEIGDEPEELNNQNKEESNQFRQEKSAQFESNETDEEKLPEQINQSRSTSPQIDREESIKTKPRFIQEEIGAKGSIPIPKEIINEEMDSFEDWLNESGGQIKKVFIIIVALGITTSVVFLFWGLNTNYSAAGIIAKLIVSISHLILIIFAFRYYRQHLGPNEFGAIEDDIKNGQLKNEIVDSTGYDNEQDWRTGRIIAIGVLKQFRRNWELLLLVWAFLYFVVSISGFVELKLMNSYSELVKNINKSVFSLFITLLNNLNTLFIALCFYTLNEPISIENKSHDGKEVIISLEQEDGKLVSNGLTVIFIWFFVEMLVITLFLLNQDELGNLRGLETFQNLLMGISGIFGGLAMALLVARFQSKFLKSPNWLLITLFLYTVIQSLFIYFGDKTEEKVAVTVIIGIALFLKSLLILFIFWLFQSGRLLFYLVRVRRASQQTEGQWQLFRSVLKYKNNDTESSG